MTAYHPKASMTGCQTVATPAVMPPKFQRPKPAGTVALEAAIEAAKAEGRALDPIAEFWRAVKSERDTINILSNHEGSNLKPPRASTAAMSAAQKAYRAPFVAAAEEKIILAINQGFFTWAEIRRATGFSEHRVSARLMCMLKTGRLHRNKGRNAVYSITANNAAIAAE